MKKKFGKILQFHLATIGNNVYLYALTKSGRIILSTDEEHKDWTIIYPKK